MSDGLPLDLQKKIFAALVTAQDGGASVNASRKETARRFRLSVAEVERIERRGLDHKWPPLE
jgi:hypothetical protein